ncbi:RING-H2 finger protein ATL43-like [Nymphaea colorata]|nr:RING-H2 finger protein ATL43-like [Nymphaea colorata]
MKLLLFLCLVLPISLAEKLHKEERANQFDTAVPVYLASFSIVVVVFSMITVLCAQWRTGSCGPDSEDGDVRVHGGSLYVHLRTFPVAEEIINSLPVLRFSSLSCSSEGLEKCPICLAKFEEADALRLLPKCSHSFHMKCIDGWLQTNSTCPVCRQMVEARDLLQPLHGSPDSGCLEKTAE